MRGEKTSLKGRGKQWLDRSDFGFEVWVTGLGWAGRPEYICELEKMWSTVSEKLQMIDAYLQYGQKN